MKRVLVVSLGGLALVAACTDSLSNPTTPVTLAPTLKPSAYVAAPTATGATVSTDKEDYAPGDLVTITGKGWAPREAVHLNLAENPVADGPHDWDVVADSTGAFTDKSFTPGQQHLGVTFTLTASGATSGTSTAIFTDGNFQVQGRDGGQHQLIGNAEVLGTVEHGVPVSLSCQAETPDGLSVKRAGSYSGVVTWTTTFVAISPPSGTTALPSATVALSPSSGTLASASEEDCVTMTVATSGLTIGQTYIGGLKATAAGDTDGFYYFKFTVTAPKPKDETPPTITPTITGTLGSSGWYTSDVTLTWTVIDNESAITNTDCVTQNITVDQAATTYSCSATSTGGTTTATPVSIKRDATLPTASATPSPAANANGWNKTNVTVTFSGSDAGSGLVGCNDAVILSNEGSNLSASGICTDAAGNTRSATASGINIDKTAPTASYQVSPAASTYGWHKGSATVSFGGSDAVSGIAFCSPSITLSSEGAGQPASGTCTDLAGNVSNAATATINIDLNAPTIGGTPTPAADVNGWNNNDVSIAWTCDDALSGIPTGTCPANSLISTEGKNLSATGSVSDKAGNSASATVSGINLDKTAPAISVTGVSQGATYTLGSVPTAGCSTASDALSGVASSTASPSVTGPTSVNGALVGTVTARCTATDNAGNTRNSSVSYTVNFPWTGFFQPVDNDAINTMKAGNAVPVKFSLGGYYGLNIFSAGYPKPITIPCGGTLGIDEIEVTVNAGSSSLTYDSTVGQYVYVWKTDTKGWASGTCRQLILVLADGSTPKTAIFQAK